jgi:membrane-bound serine protease (ClpP class)
MGAWWDEWGRGPLLAAGSAHAGWDAVRGEEPAYLFLASGLLALVYEFASPGVGVAGAIGIVLLAFGFVALDSLRFDAVGLTLILGAGVLFAGGILLPWAGPLALVGTVALLLGGALLFPGAGVHPGVLWPAALAAGGGALLAGRIARRARRTPPASGSRALIGREAVVRRASDATGQVLLDGAWWTVRRADGPVAEGQRVRVVGATGLELKVDRVADEEESP